MKRALAAFISTVTLAAATATAQDVQQGIALYQQGKYADAANTLRSASGAEAKAYLAASLAKQKQFAEAETAAKAALSDAATHEVALSALGESLVAQKKYDEAVERMTTAIGVKADIAYAYYWRATAYQYKKQVARMVDDFKTFLRLAPNAPEAGSVKVLLASQA